MITEFWNWMFSTVTQAVNTLNTFYNNTMFRPFFDLFLVVLGVGVIMKFIIHPLIASGFVGESEKATKRYQKQEEKRIKSEEKARNK